MEVNSKEEESHQTSSNLSEFVKELSTYFMEFLETNFHKRRVPKRSIKYKNSNNLRLGLNLKKFPSFNTKIWKSINDLIESSEKLTVKKGKYTAPIPTNLINLIDQQIEKISSEEIENLVNNLERIIKKMTEKHQNEADVALSNSLDEASNLIRQELVNPFLKHLEKPFENAELGDIESIYAIEEELTDVLAEPLNEPITNIVNGLIIGENPDLKKQLKENFQAEGIKNSIDDFFQNLAVKDLYHSIRELKNNLQILDKKQLYLYFSDIAFERRTYPIFYIPLSVQKREKNLNFHLIQELM
jgi:hypothetical protein